MAKAKRKSSKKIKTLTANRIVLKSPGGKVKACMDASSEEYVSIDLYGNNGGQLSLCVDSDNNPKVNFSGKDGKIKLSLGLSDQMGAGLHIADAEGRPVCFIFVPDDGIPRTRLYQIMTPKSGKVFWKTPVPSNKNAKK